MVVSDILERLTDVGALLAEVWPATLVSAFVLLGGVCAGWRIAQNETTPIVRLIGWWLSHVIIPWLRSGSWWVRAATIFTNNTIVLAAVAASGFRPGYGALAVLSLGTSLGIGLRILSAQEDRFAAPSQLADGWTRFRVRLGVVLNLLEPPAILLATTLSLARFWLPVPMAQMWWAYGACAVPLLFVAAGGEALWLGVYRFQPDEPASTLEDADRHV